MGRLAEHPERIRRHGVDMVSRPIAERFAVYLVRLDPTVGAEMRKTRPCVVVSPEQMHRNLHTVIIAPMTGTLTG